MCTNNRAPACSFSPDPGLQPGSRTLPLETGQRAWRLHLRQPQGQPSPPHGQRQHGPEVCLSNRFCSHSSLCRGLAAQPHCSRVSSAAHTPQCSLHGSVHRAQPHPRDAVSVNRENSLALGNSWTALSLPPFCSATGRWSFKPFGGRSWWKAQ